MPLKIEPLFMFSVSGLKLSSRYSGTKKGRLRKNKPRQLGRLSTDMEVKPYLPKPTLT